MAFSDLLKDAQNAQKFKVAATVKPAASSTSVMSLGLDESMTNSNLNSNSLMLNDTEEEWTLSSKYETTEKNTDGKRYSDDKYSTVDEKKTVKMDPSQINLTQESNSQYIPFLMPRYFDGIDLMNMELSIYYINADNAEGTANIINVCYNSTQIKFGWVLDKEATAIKGKLTFEIHARGTDPLGGEYLLKTKPNSQLEVLESLHGNGQIIYDESWITTFYRKIDESVAKAETAAETAEKHLATIQNIVDNAETDLTGYSKEEADELLALKANQADLEIVQSNVEDNTLAISGINDVNNGILAQSKEYTDGKVGILPEGITSTNVVDYVTELLLNYYTKEEVDGLDISEKLSGIEGRVKTLEDDFASFDGLAALSITYDETTNTLSFFNGEEKIKDIVLDISSDIANALVPINEDLQSIHDNIDNLPTTLESDYYKKEKTDELLALKADKTELNTVKSTADANKTDIGTLSTTVAELSDAVANMDTSESLIYDIKYEDNQFSLLEGTSEETLTLKTTVTITGGSGGVSTSSSLKIEYITKTPLVVTVDDKALIKFRFSGTDSSGDAVLEGQATWKIAGSVVATDVVVDGENEFDITNYLTIGSQKVQLSVVDDAGTLVTKSWTVQKVDVRLESTFNDTFTYPLGDVSFAYTPYGAIEKDVHFILDGEEIGIVKTSASGIPMAYTLPSQEHGSHLLEVYMTATVNNNAIESNHIFKDILWYDSTSSIPVIGCTQQKFTATQYATTNIVYTVHDSSTETPEVTIAVDRNVVATKTLESNTDTYSFRSDEVGTHEITITCGETVKTIIATITKLDIVIEPVTAGLVFDFNPVGKSNNAADRLWTYSGNNGSYAMTVSDNFDWVNGGYQLDENGEQYFCIKAGTSAEINYQMFADDAKKTGKECKLVFKTTNVQEANAQFMSCIDNTTGSDHIGIEMFVHEAYVYGSADKLQLKYSENDVIEFEFNIASDTEKVPKISGYEDGISTRHLIYDDSFNFTQNTPKVITLGSDKCDLHIYRFKTYNTSLTDRGILNNFIADARNAEEMINRYNRNQIYNENQELTPEILAEKCPWLRVYVVSAPYFTNKKSDKVPYTTIRQIYKNGDSILDNWTCYDCSHSGQGTSSDNYGASGRNLDFIMNKSQREGVEPYFILGDGKTRATKISLTRTSIPVAYLNFKNNIASCNHFTNAKLAKRYNEFNPYKLPYIREDESIIDYIKTTMEFYNAVVFIQETDTDLSTHREFADNLVHFYGLGNIGDSKKTDKSRLIDQADRYECINEICDVELPLSDWANTPEALASLEAEKFDKSGTYEWRYIWEDGTDEENAEVREYCKQRWIEMYKFVVQSTDEEFKAHFDDYFVKDSILYYYLFTTRYCMVDNRAKNLFPHYGKTGEFDEDGNPIRKWDLVMAYDMDSSMSLNNYGNSVYRHGYEDTDTMDGTDEEVFRESDSTLFCRVRDLFADELAEMYNTLESKNAWHAESFLNEIEEWQNQFPEELWRLDCERKYIRSYGESFINGAGDPQYLKNMAQGKMKYAVKQWERSQEAYMASKYQSSVASSDNAVLRCTVPTGNLAVEPNYKLKLTPYDYMYLNVKYGTQEPIQVRANPGVQYEIPFEGTSVDIIDIYSASRIQDLGDLSTTYPATVDTAKATRLKELHIGNSTEGYDNPYLTTMTLGANYLLEVLNVENVSGLTQSLNLSALNNLRELYAHGTNTGGVTFSNSGAIEIAELPAITSMTAKNLVYLTNLDIASLDKLTTLTIENCDTIDVKTMLETAPNVNRVRITGIDWILTDTTLLEKIYKMSGIDKNGYNTTQSVLAGTVHVPVIKQQQLADYHKAWSDLEITYDTMIEQFAVIFVNADENHTVLEVQYVDKGESAIDPTKRIDNPLSPTLPSTISHDYTFSNWDSSLSGVFSDRTITAVYTESLRKYKIKYVSKGTVMEGYPKEGYYGDNIVYTGNTPTYTSEESAYKYYLFNRWDKSGFLTGDFDENGVKTVNAIYDEFKYTDKAFEGKELSELSPVEIYAMNKLGMYRDVVTDMDDYTIELGHDFNYDDIESQVIVSEKKTFDTTNYFDTGIQLFDIDRDFVLAIDYKFTEAIDNSVLVQCYQGNGSIGFQLLYNTGTDSGVKAKWTASTTKLTSANEREMVVIRHRKGDTNLYVYNSNLSGSAISVVSLSSKEFTTNSTLVFGCNKKTSTNFTDYASGEIYWCKLWYADLGSEVCRQLAAWTHEKITLEACGFNRYYTSDNPDEMCSFSLLASGLLDRKSKWNTTNTNVGGWATSKLNSFLNTRLYEAMPTQIKSLLKQVKIDSSAGNKSEEIVSSDCYIAVPALKEVNPGINKEPYNSEGTTISYFNQAQVSPKRAFADGTYYAYWLRSPNVEYTNYVYRIDAEGKVQAITNATDELGIVILLSF